MDIDDVNLYLTRWGVKNALRIELPSIEFGRVHVVAADVLGQQSRNPGLT
jgi:hypothetical protein